VSFAGANLPLMLGSSPRSDAMVAAVPNAVAKAYGSAGKIFVRATCASVSLRNRARTPIDMQRKVFPALYELTESLKHGAGYEF
jgi:hypothetical protein